MIISKSSKVVFIHVQKTGGKSVASMLRSALPDAKRRKRMHSTILDVPKYILRDWDSYYSFAFVRNPWDRAVSWWKYNGKGTFREFVSGCKLRGGAHKLLWRDQISYLSVPSYGAEVRHIFRYEQFDEGCRQWCSDLGVGEIPIPHKGRSRHDHYSSYYDDDTIAVVAARFARDIQAFGYTFEGTCTGELRDATAR